MADWLDFTPDPKRAQMMNGRVHEDLGRSIAHVCERSRGIVPFDASALDALVACLQRGQRCHPAVFSIYYDLVADILNDDLTAAEADFARLAVAQSQPDGMQIRALDAPEISGYTARYQRLMSGDAGMQVAIRPPSAEQAETFRDEFQAGWVLLEQVAPELAGEVQAIVHEVVVVTGDPDSDVQFDGGSHYQLWGGLFLNRDFPRAPHEMLEVIAHECTHSLLFGFCCDEALVNNADDELYDSPLRQDARPMDGIYHATFVSARMHWAMSRLLASDLLSAEAREQVAKARRQDAENFEMGYEVVSRHGKLTRLGRGLMAGARGYMTRAV